MLATYTLFYLMTAWASSYGTKKSTAEHVTNLGIPATRFIELQLIAVPFFAVCIPLSGWLADRMGRKPVLISITVGIIVFGLTFDKLIGPAVASEASMLGFLIVGMTLMGLTFGPMSAVLPELFPTNVRYTGSGISYNMASIIGAAVARSSRPPSRPATASALWASTSRWRLRSRWSRWSSPRDPRRGADQGLSGCAAPAGRCGRDVESRRGDPLADGEDRGDRRTAGAGRRRGDRAGHRVVLRRTPAGPARRRMGGSAEAEPSGTVVDGVAHRRRGRCGFTRLAGISGAGSALLRAEEVGALFAAATDAEQIFCADCCRVSCGRGAGWRGD